MRAGSPPELTLAAIRSTAASLTSDDVILLRIDGGELDDPWPYQEAAAPVPLVVRPAPVARGLAVGLNALIDEVLSDPRWQLIARMDVDDESLSGRMEAQRQFFAANPQVDILGTACVEVDQRGRQLQVKRMPLSHAAIVRTLPRANPLNHPTVMFRRRVFVSGLRYRTDVSRIEDYHLWIDAVRAGFVLANLPQPLLNYRRDDAFFRRRGGLRQAWADLRVRCHAIRGLGLQHPCDPLWPLAAFVLRLLPGPLQQRLYARLR